jgi:hypothetical protein
MREQVCILVPGGCKQGNESNLHSFQLLLGGLISFGNEDECVCDECGRAEPSQVALGKAGWEQSDKFMPDA